MHHFRDKMMKSERQLPAAEGTWAMLFFQISLIHTFW